MSATRQVCFGRINRRNASQQSFDQRTFAQDMLMLAESRRTTAEVRSKNVRNVWIAADMQLDASGDFMTGLLGYRVNQQVLSFDDSSWSWTKGETSDTHGASSDSVVPFVIDVRDKQRWVAFATSDRIRHRSFATGFHAVLNEAVTALEIWDSEWEFDLVTSKESINNWIEQHPYIAKVTRSVRFSNPGLDIDRDREEMRKLHAKRKTEEFAAYPNSVLDTNSEEFISKIDGVERGDLDLVLSARSNTSSGMVRFNSKQSFDRTTIPDFGVNYPQGVESVLDALREYLSERNLLESSEKTSDSE